MPWALSRKILVSPNVAGFIHLTPTPHMSRSGKLMAHFRECDFCGTTIVVALNFMSSSLYWNVNLRFRSLRIFFITRRVDFHFRPIVKYKARFWEPRRVDIFHCVFTLVGATFLLKDRIFS